jgi:hypothetical protein
MAADQDAATMFAERFEKLRITGGAPAPGATDKGTFTIVDGVGEYTLQLSQGDDEGEVIVRSSRRDGLYTIAGYVAEQVLESADKLKPKNDAEPAADVTQEASTN